MKKEKERLDTYLHTRGYFPTRSRARDAIRRKTVRVNGKLIDKAGFLLSDANTVQVDDPGQAYVSRAALKLLGALKHFCLSFKDCTVLDLGCSTGGFTQVVLERGARCVVAVDVGHDQLAPALRGDSRIVLYEGLNAKELTRAHFQGHSIDRIVCDVSFISVKQALPAALDLAAKDAYGLFLIKPQFEIGRAALGKGGLIKDVSKVPGILEDIISWLKDKGWDVLGCIAAALKGADGNQEYFLYAQKISA